MIYWPFNLLLNIVGIALLDNLVFLTFEYISSSKWSEHNLWFLFSISGSVVGKLMDLQCSIQTAHLELFKLLVGTYKIICNMW